MGNNLINKEPPQYHQTAMVNTMHAMITALYTKPFALHLLMTRASSKLASILTVLM